MLRAEAKAYLADSVPAPMPQTIFNQAVSFHEGARRCATPRHNGSKVQVSSIPMIVCLAFACEMYLKAALSYRFSKKVEGHDLFKLYEQLADEDRRNIRRTYRDVSGDLLANVEQEIADISNCFVKWRYLYEKQNETFLFVADLIAFTRALHFFVLKHINHWPIDQDVKREIESEWPEALAAMLDLGGSRSVRGVIHKPKIRIRVKFITNFGV